MYVPLMVFFHRDTIDMIFLFMTVKYALKIGLNNLKILIKREKANWGAYYMHGHKCPSSPVPCQPRSAPYGSPPRLAHQGCKRSLATHPLHWPLFHIHEH
jgi:hypothetical protein